MIAELVVTMSSVSGDNGYEMTDQKMLFPEPAVQVGRHLRVERLSREKLWERTFAVDPQKRTV